MMLSGCFGLVQAFASGADIHKATAAEVFGKTLDEKDNQKLIDEAIARLKEQKRE